MVEEMDNSCLWIRGVIIHIYAAYGMSEEQAPNGRTFANLALLVSLFATLNTVVLRPFSWHSSIRYCLFLSENMKR